MDGHRLLEELEGRREEMLDALAALVAHESPSRDKARLDALAAMIGGRLGAIGGDVARIENATGGDHVVARFGAGAGGGARPALVLGHHDTVWPAGTLAGMPFRVEGGRAHGPGIYDMKASLVLIEFALAAIATLGLVPPRPIVALITSDEEIGSPTSRALIEREAAGAAHVLVVEPPLPGGALKTARKGVGGFTVEVEGLAAHAGVEPEKGVSAILELAHQVLHLHTLGDPEAGTTVNVGVVRGGTAPNVVAAGAAAQVDVRAWTRDEALRIEEAMRSLRPRLPGARVVARGGFSRPPMERTTQGIELFRKAQVVGRSLGLELDEGSTGGGSDGNFTAAIGVPTLDGLGVPGAGAHAEHEHILVDHLPIRAALLAALMLGI